jgi:hypothetical protein
MLERFNVFTYVIIIKKQLNKQRKGFTERHRITFATFCEIKQRTEEKFEKREDVYQPLVLFTQKIVHTRPMHKQPFYHPYHKNPSAFHKCGACAPEVGMLNMAMQIVGNRP